MHFSWFKEFDNVSEKTVVYPTPRLRNQCVDGDRHCRMQMTIGVDGRRRSRRDGERVSETERKREYLLREGGERIKIKKNFKTIENPVFYAKKIVPSAAITISVDLADF